MKPNFVLSRRGGRSPFAALLFICLLLCGTPSFSQCWKQVAPSFNYCMALKEDGTLWGWGSFSSGQLGIPPSGFLPQLTSMPSGTATDWAYVNTGTQYSLAIKTNGTLWAWGGNATGALGIGNTTQQKGVGLCRNDF